MFYITHKISLSVVQFSCKICINCLRHGEPLPKFLLFLLCTVVTHVLVLEKGGKNVNRLTSGRSRQHAKHKQRRSAEWKPFCATKVICWHLQWKKRWKFYIWKLLKQLDVSFWIFVWNMTCHAQCNILAIASMHHVHCILIKLNIPRILNTHPKWCRC